METTHFQWFITYDNKPITPPVTDEVEAGFEKLQRVYRDMCKLFEPVRLQIVEVKFSQPCVDHEKTEEQ